MTEHEHTGRGNTTGGMTRRDFVRGAAVPVAGAASLAAAGCGGRDVKTSSGKAGQNFGRVKKGRIKQSFAAWCYTGENGKGWNLDQLCRFVKALGCPAVEVLDPEDFPTLKKYGLVCSMTNTHTFVRGMNNPLHWDECHAKLRTSIDANAAAGFPNVISFTGFADTTKEGGSTVDREEGFKNCVAGFKKIVGYAEKKKVNICIEMLNSRDPVPMKGHPGYQGDHMDYCIDIVKKVGSPRLKVLFDIYHVQIMDGDLIRRIREYGEYIGDVHLGGVPGRNEMDETQEINYPPVLAALLEAGYDGYCAHEWIPTRDAEQSIREMVALCDI